MNTERTITMYAIAWDYDPDNPNPHPLVLDSSTLYRSDGLATAAAERLADDEDEIESGCPFVIIEVRL